MGNCTCRHEFLLVYSCKTRYFCPSCHQVRVGERDGRMKLAGYMIRAPMSLAKMTYDRASGTVIYRSKMHL